MDHPRASVASRMWAGGSIDDSGLDLRAQQPMHSLAAPHSSSPAPMHHHPFASHPHSHASAGPAGSPPRMLPPPPLERNVSAPLGRHDLLLGHDLSRSLLRDGSGAAGPLLTRSATPGGTAFDSMQQYPSPPRSSVGSGSGASTGGGGILSFDRIGGLAPPKTRRAETTNAPYRHHHHHGMAPAAAAAFSAVDPFDSPSDLELLFQMAESESDRTGAGAMSVAGLDEYAVPAGSHYSRAFSPGPIGFRAGASPVGLGLGTSSPGGGGGTSSSVSSMQAPPPHLDRHISVPNLLPSWLRDAVPEKPAPRRSGLANVWSTSSTPPPPSSMQQQSHHPLAQEIQPSDPLDAAAAAHQFRHHVHQQQQQEPAVPVVTHRYQQTHHQVYQHGQQPSQSQSAAVSHQQQFQQQPAVSQPQYQQPSVPAHYQQSRAFEPEQYSKQQHHHQQYQQYNQQYQQQHAPHVPTSTGGTSRQWTSTAWTEPAVAPSTPTSVHAPPPQQQQLDAASWDLDTSSSYGGTTVIGTEQPEPMPYINVNDPEHRQYLAAQSSMSTAAPVMVDAQGQPLMYAYPASGGGGAMVHDQYATGGSGGAGEYGGHYEVAHMQGQVAPPYQSPPTYENCYVLQPTEMLQAVPEDPADVVWKPIRYPVVKINNIPWDVTIPDVQQYLAPIPVGYMGGLPMVHITMIRETGKTRSDAFVELCCMDDVMLALRDRQRRILRGRVVTVHRSSQAELMRTVFPAFAGEFQSLNAVPFPPHHPYYQQRQQEILQQMHIFPAIFVPRGPPSNAGSAPSTPVRITPSATATEAAAAVPTTPTAVVPAASANRSLEAWPPLGAESPVKKPVVGLDDTPMSPTASASAPSSHGGSPTSATFPSAAAEPAPTSAAVTVPEPAAAYPYTSAAPSTTSDTSDTAVTGPPEIVFLSRAEINQVLAVCKSFKLFFSRKCSQRPFENVMIILLKFPWHQRHLISTMQRDHLFEMAKLTVETLRAHLVKPSHSMDATLMARLLRSIFIVPAFTDRQKAIVLDTAGFAAWPPVPPPLRQVQTLALNPVAAAVPYMADVGYGGVTKAGYAGGGGEGTAAFVDQTTMNAAAASNGTLGLAAPAPAASWTGNLGGYSAADQHEQQSHAHPPVFEPMHSPPSAMATGVVSATATTPVKSSPLSTSAAPFWAPISSASPVVITPAGPLTLAVPPPAPAPAAAVTMAMSPPTVYLPASSPPMVMTTVAGSPPRPVVATVGQLEGMMGGLNVGAVGEEAPATTAAAP
ncbi:hypothetical protein H9P43_007676 [Blastocladiella emersonii ATCC 22665]|nr:hypothetical protein H9P43_007676 [Blastocladiella emersonii ATCC 22665]